VVVIMHVLYLWFDNTSQWEYREWHNLEKEVPGCDLDMVSTLSMLPGLGNVSY